MAGMLLAGNLRGEALDEVERILAVQQAVSVAVKAWRNHGGGAPAPHAR